MPATADRPRSRKRSVTIAGVAVAVGIAVLLALLVRPSRAQPTVPPTVLAAVNNGVTAPARVPMYGPQGLLSGYKVLSTSQPPAGKSAGSVKQELWLVGPKGAESRDVTNVVLVDSDVDAGISEPPDNVKVKKINGNAVWRGPAAAPGWESRVVVLDCGTALLTTNGSGGDWDEETAVRRIDALHCGPDGELQVKPVDSLTLIYSGPGLHLPTRTTFFEVQTPLTANVSVQVGWTQPVPAKLRTLFAQQDPGTSVVGVEVNRQQGWISKDLSQDKFVLSFLMAAEPDGSTPQVNIIGSDPMELLEIGKSIANVERF